MALFKNTKDSAPGIQSGESIEVNGVSYMRYPIKMPRLINFGENLDNVIIEFVKPHYQKGDWLVISQKVMSISQNLVRHISTVRVTWLARFITLGVLKHKNMTAWSRPEKMQVAIDMVGAPRIIVAAVAGSIGKLLGKRGWFWIVAGHHISEIDGFQGEGDMYENFGILPSPDSPGDCEQLEKNTGIPTVTADANFINTEVLGVSTGVGLDAKTVRLIILDNPLGQGNKMTPFVLVRKFNPVK